MAEVTFRLNDKFVEKYRNVQPPFGFNGLGEFIYLRTYSRIKADGTNEVWYETVRRVVEGTYRMQERHIKEQDLGWSPSRAQKSAQEMYDRIFNMKFLPPGRGLWAMGSDLTEERGIYAALNNCMFISTEFIDKELSESFCTLMDASMLGIGVGFDLAGAGKITVNKPWSTNPAYTKVSLTDVCHCCKGDEAWVLDCHTCSGAGNIKRTGGQYIHIYLIPDSREGWVESVRLLLESYLKPNINQVHFQYDLIRPKGEPIKGFGGVASGPDPLIALHDAIRHVLDSLVGKPITAEAIADIMNLIGVCVVAGNVRRTAEIMFGSPYDEEYLRLKDYHWDAKEGIFVGYRSDRAPHGWTSNNSVFADIGMDYENVASYTHGNGEPGYMWLENARAYGRMGDLIDNRDKKVRGANPCAEQSLEHMELCCLVETFPDRHETIEDFQRTLKFAYLYAKTVTLGKTHWRKTNQVLLRNRRIGTSMSGIQQFVAHRGLDALKRWSEAGYNTIQEYDRIYSDWLAIPRSIKTTSIKPSGTVSLLAGATPGMHWPESVYYTRRVRVSKLSPYVQRFRDANYVVEDDVNDPSSVVVEFPICIGEGLRSVSDVTMWEQFSMAAFLQRYWADNQVSCTVTFDHVTNAEIARCLDYYQYQLKGISLLPKLAAGAYPQMPYEEISEDSYYNMVGYLKPLNLSGIAEEAIPEMGCNADVCEIKNWSKS